MSWGGLNPALTAWRNAVMKRFPDKDTSSDGARADAAHSSTSQHQADSDGTVDAYDMDVNLFKGSPASGTAIERRLIEAMKLDFEQDPYARGRIWIHYGEIANFEIGDWQERVYVGANPHDKHVHWESRQSRERDGRAWPMPHTDALLKELRGEEDVAIDKKDAELIADTLIAKIRNTKEVLSDTNVMLIGQDAAGRLAPALARIEAALKLEVAEVPPTAAQNAAAVLAALGSQPADLPAQTAAKIRAALAPVLGSRAPEVFRAIGEGQ